MLDYLIVGAALALAVFILARQVMRIGHGGGCGCEGGAPPATRSSKSRRRAAGRATPRRFPRYLDDLCAGLALELLRRRPERSCERGREARGGAVPGLPRRRGDRPSGREQRPRRVHPLNLNLNLNLPRFR